MVEVFDDFDDFDDADGKSNNKEVETDEVDAYNFVQMLSLNFDIDKLVDVDTDNNVGDDDMFDVFDDFDCLDDVDDNQIQQVAAWREVDAYDDFDVHSFVSMQSILLSTTGRCVDSERNVGDDDMVDVTLLKFMTLILLISIMWLLIWR